MPRIINKTDELSLMDRWIAELEPAEGYILYSDIVESTRIAWEARIYAQGKPNVGYIACHNLFIVNVLQQWDGKLGNKWGDGVLCLFDSPEMAIGAAVDFMQSFEKNANAVSRFIEEQKIVIRIGLHFGKYFILPQGWERSIMNGQFPPAEYVDDRLISKEEIIGANICLSQLIQSLADGGQIFASQNFVDQIDTDRLKWTKDQSCGTIRIADENFIVEQTCAKPRLKGISHPPILYCIEMRVPWLVSKISKKFQFRGKFSIGDKNRIIGYLKETYAIGTTRKEIDAIFEL